MNLADKPCYPNNDEIWEKGADLRGGLTFRERLIIALASNGEFFKFCWNRGLSWSEQKIKAADELIKQLEDK